MSAFEYKNRADLLAEARRIIAAMHTAVSKAGVRREWNRTFRISIPSKNDVKRGAVQNLESLNDICMFHGWDKVYVNPEDDEVKVGKVE